MKIPPPAPTLQDLFDDDRVARLPALLASDIGKLPENKYLHWSKLKYLNPPEGFSSEEWWIATKMARRSVRHALPLDDKMGRPFAFSDSGYLYRMLHEVDRDAGGRIELPADVVTADSRSRYLVSSLIEEAITSSQLEGAATTRRVAREMLRSGRRPRDRSERMIVRESPQIAQRVLSDGAYGSLQACGASSGDDRQARSGVRFHAGGGLRSEIARAGRSSGSSQGACSHGGIGRTWFEPVA